MLMGDGGTSDLQRMMVLLFSMEVVVLLSLRMVVVVFLRAEKEMKGREKDYKKGRRKGKERCWKTRKAKKGYAKVKKTAE